MLRIGCPYCGVRDELEFSFGGPTHIARPPLDCDDVTWTTYLYERDNPAGVHFERWLHVYGCGRWFNMARNTVTHEVLAIYKVGEPKPPIPRAAA